MSSSDEHESSEGYTLEAGAIVAGRYRILSRLGTGGMGSVYLAADSVLGDERVAIKVLHRNYTNSQVQTARFLREVQLMRKISHKNVVRTYDVGTDGDILYFTMEFVPGAPLDRLVGPKGVAIDKLVSYATQIAEALSAIHAAGIVHRDLKPGNVLVLEDETLRITDFGVARPDYSELTAHNEILGSVCYMAPEIWLGQKLTASVDLYAFGVILYELATGDVPHDGESPAQLMRAHLDRAPVPPKERNANVPGWLDKLILKLLAKGPEERPRDAQAVLETLQLHTGDHGSGDKHRRSSAAQESTSFFETMEAKTQTLTSGVHKIPPGGDSQIMSMSQQKLSVIRKSVNSGSGSYALDRRSAGAASGSASGSVTGYGSSSGKFSSKIKVTTLVPLALAIVLALTLRLLAAVLTSETIRSYLATEVSNLAIISSISMGSVRFFAVLEMLSLSCSLALLPMVVGGVFISGAALLRMYAFAAGFLFTSGVALLFSFQLLAPEGAAGPATTLSAVVAAKDQLSAVGILSPTINLYELRPAGDALAHHATAVGSLGASKLVAFLAFGYLFLVTRIVIPNGRHKGKEKAKKNVLAVAIALGFLMLVEPFVVGGLEISAWRDYGLLNLRLPLLSFALGLGHWAVLFFANYLASIQTKR